MTLLIFALILLAPRQSFDAAQRRRLRMGDRARGRRRRLAEVETGVL